MEKHKFLYITLLTCLAMGVIILIFLSMQPVDNYKSDNVSQNVTKTINTSADDKAKKEESSDKQDVDVISTDAEDKKVEDEGIKLVGYAEKYENTLQRGISFTMSTQGITYKVKLKGSKVRMESTAGNQKIIFIVNDNAIYLYQPRLATATKISSEKAIDNVKLNSNQISEISDKSAEKTTKNGYSCLLFKLGDANEVCISENYNIPVYVNFAGNVVNYSNISSANISDSDFKLPSNVKVVEMNVPKLPESATTTSTQEINK